LQGRGDGRQKISKTLLSLRYRRRTDHLTIEVEEVEQEEDESVGVARIRSRLDQAERGLPISGNAAELAIKISLLYRQNRPCRGYSRVFVRPVQAGARQQLDPAAVQLRACDIRHT